MKSSRITIGTIRREQIIDAAVAVIAEQGLQNLSLSEIESRVGMSRGQLTYYFKAKEDIFLAVFDRLLVLLCSQHGDSENGPGSFDNMSWLEVMSALLRMLMRQPPAHPEFHALQYTFLSQIGHRADFRQRLAELYEEWRGHSARHLARELKERPPLRPVSPRALATLVQAILHGLVMQTAVDPGAFDPHQIAELCLDILSSYLWQSARRPGKKRPTPPNKNNKKRQTTRRSARTARSARVVINGEKT